MNTLDALQKRKSIRGYLDKTVEKEKLNLILKYGNKAPNAGPFQMSVITNKEILKTINDTAQSIEQKTMTLQYFETLKTIGTSASTKYIFPMEFTSLLDNFRKKD